MSDIPKSEQSESKLRTLHQAYKIRKMIMAELMASFAYSQKKQERHIRAMTAHIVDPKEKEETAQKIRELEENFDLWFIKRERDKVADLCEGIARHLRMANTIWPDYVAEFTERRLQLDKALECCNALQDELQYIAEVLPADKNKYMAIVLELDTEFKWIKKLRQSDNRFIPHLKDELIMNKDFWGDLCNCMRLLSDELLQCQQQWQCEQQQRFEL